MSQRNHERLKGMRVQEMDQARRGRPSGRSSPRLRNDWSRSVATSTPIPRSATASTAPPRWWSTPSSGPAWSPRCCPSAPGPSVTCCPGDSSTPRAWSGSGPTSTPCRSRRQGRAVRVAEPGVCHACGHDVHTAIVLGVGQVLARLRDLELLPRGVRLIFQPAEETSPGGALDAIDGGVLHGPDRDLRACTATRVPMSVSWRSRSGRSRRRWTRSTSPCPVSVVTPPGLT